MKAVRVYLGVAALSLLCAGCFPARVTQVPGASGIVLDYSTLRPIQDAEAVVRNPRQNSQHFPEHRPVTTKGNGRFSIPARHRWGVSGLTVTLSMASGDLEISHEGYTTITIPLRVTEIGGGFRVLPETSAPDAMGRILPDDILNPTAFATKLKSGADPVSAYLFTRFSQDGKSAVLASPPVNSEILKGVLARELDDVLAGGVIYDTNRFQDVTLSLRTTQFLAHYRGLERLGLSDAAYRASYPHATDQGFTRAVLNRELLADAYPDDLRKTNSPDRRPERNLGVILMDRTGK